MRHTCVLSHRWQPSAQVFPVSGAVYNRCLGDRCTMACFLLVWLLHQKGIGILHPLMLSGLGITATPSRVKDVITNSAALQVVRARFIACLDFSALMAGLLVWHLADDSLQPEQQGCYPEWPSWFQLREHLWDRVACMSDASGLLQFCRFCSLMSDKAPVCLWGAASFGLRQQASGAACRQ